MRARQKQTRGSTLIEVMMACVVLMFLAVVGASYVYHSARSLAMSRNRSVAMARANSRMEEVCGTAFAVLTNRTFSANVAWIKWNGTNWVSGTDETFPNGGAACPLLTQLSNGVDRVKVTVWAGYRAGQTVNDDMVRLDTVCAPVD